MASSKDVRPAKITDDNVEDMYRRWQNDKALTVHAAERLESLRLGLLAYAETHGVTDDGGHQWVTLPSGAVFKRQFSDKKTINTERIRAWLEEVGRLGEVEYEKTVTVWDEDSFWSVVDEEELTEEQIDDFYDKKPVYSFIPGES